MLTEISLPEQQMTVYQWSLRTGHWFRATDKPWVMSIAVYLL